MERQRSLRDLYKEPVNHPAFMFFKRKPPASVDPQEAAARAEAARDLGIADPEGRLSHTDAIALAALMAAGPKGSPAYEAVLTEYRAVMGLPHPDR